MAERQTIDARAAGPSPARPRHSVPGLVSKRLSGLHDRANAGPSSQRLKALQHMIDAHAARVLPVRPPMQFGGRYNVPNAKGTGMQRKSVSSMSTAQLQYFLHNFSPDAVNNNFHAPAEDIEAARQALAQKQGNVSANTKSAEAAALEEAGRRKLTARETGLREDKGYAPAREAFDRETGASFEFFANYIIDLVNEANLARLTDQRLAEIKAVVNSILENMVEAKVAADTDRLASVEGLAYSDAVRAHHKEFQRVHLSLARFGSGAAANKELSTNPIAFEGANPDLKYDIETEHTRKWYTATGIAQIASFMGVAYVRILINKMCMFTKGKDDLMARYLSEMGLAIKNAAFVHGDGLKRAFGDIKRGNSLSAYIGPVAELQELNGLVHRGELAPDSQIELGETRERPRVTGMKADAPGTQEVDLAFTMKTGKRQLREVKADPITMEAALVKSGNPSDQMLSYGSLRSGRKAPSAAEVRAPAEGVQVVWACPSSKDWPVPARFPLRAQRGRKDAQPRPDRGTAARSANAAPGNRRGKARGRAHLRPTGR